MRVNLQKISYSLIIACIIWFPYQDLCLSFVYRHFPSPLLKIGLVGKELCILAALIILWVRKALHGRHFSGQHAELVSYVLVTFCILYVFVTQLLAADVPFFTVATSFRSSILPIMLFLAGFWLSPTLPQVQFILKTIILISVVNVLIGFFETIVPVSVFWNGTLDLYGYLSNIKGLQTGTGREGGFINLVPGNFWAFVGLRRMAGGIASPLALGYYLVLPIVIAASQLKILKNQNIIILLLVIGLLLTQTRAAVIATLIGIFGYYLTRKSLFRLKINKRWLLVLVSCVSVILILTSIPIVRDFLISTVTAKESSAAGHSEAWEQSLQSVRETLVVGKGFGLAGGWAATQTGSSAAGECAYLSLMYQVGGLGLVIFLSWWLMIVMGILRKRKRTANKYLRELYLSVLFINIAYMFTGLFSDQLFTFTSIGHFWLLDGMLLSLDNTTMHQVGLQIL